jgi:flavin-binding protein dodecin
MFACEQMRQRILSTVRRGGGDDAAAAHPAAHRVADGARSATCLESRASQRNAVPGRTTRSIAKEHVMSVARVSEIIAMSNKSFDDALEQGIARAVKTLKNVKGVWIHDQSVDIENGKIVGYKMSLKVTFVLSD